MFLPYEKNMFQSNLSKNKKDILCDNGIRHCLKPGLLQTKSLSITEIYSNKRGSNYNSPFVEEDFAPARNQSRKWLTKYLKERHINSHSIH